MLLIREWITELTNANHAIATKQKEREKMGERKMLATKVRHKHTENRKSF